LKEGGDMGLATLKLRDQKEPRSWRIEQSKWSERLVRTNPKGPDTVIHLSTQRRKRILVVDNNEQMALLLKYGLSDEGLIETCRDGWEGLKKMSRQYFDAVLSDIQMPSMSGIEFFNLARQQDARISERILFFTGSLTKGLDAFFRRYNVKFLTMTAGIREIKEAVSEITKRTGVKIPSFS
jgi:CheY-like chemotaxis protein